MTRKRKAIWIGTALLLLSCGAGGFWWYWQSTAVDRKVRQLVYEAAGWPDTKMEKRLKEWKLDFLIREKPKKREQSDILDELRDIGIASIPELKQLIKNDNEQIRMYAALGFLNVCDINSSDYVVNYLLTEKDEDVMVYMISCLGKFKDRRAFETLKEVFMKRRSLHSIASRVIIELHDERTFDFFIDCVVKDENDNGIRTYAIEALETIGDPRALPVLEETMKKNTDPFIRKICEDTITHLKSAATQPGQMATSQAGTIPAND